MICPKCGFEQPDGATDCARCGVVFARYRATAAAGTILPVEPISPISPIFPESPALPPPEETLYGGPLPPLPPPPPPQQLYGDAPPPSIGWSGFQAARAFNLGAILGETFQIYFANFLPFLLLTTIAYAPAILFAVFAPSGSRLFLLSPQVITILLEVLCAPLATATITFGVFQQMRGRSTTISDCLRVGLSNLLLVLGVAVLQILAIVVGAVFCVVPALIAMAMLAVAVPVAIEERPGVFAALNRSGELTEGYRWPVFGILFILGLINFGVGIVFGLMMLALASIPVLPTLLNQAAGVVAGGLSATAAAVMYYRLRSVKESIDVDSLASVFD
jgi:hypothetical protein